MLMHYINVIVKSVPQRKKNKMASECAVPEPMNLSNLSKIRCHITVIDPQEYSELIFRKPGIPFTNVD